MKNKISIYPLSLLILLFASPLVFAVPPYLGVSVGENLSFKTSTCLSVAKQVLKNNGFQKVVQYKGGTTLFAAYRNRNPYHYKALVKCLSKSGVIVVIAVAKSPKNARQKAETLRHKIQQNKSVKRAKKTAPADDKGVCIFEGDEGVSIFEDDKKDSIFEGDKSVSTFTTQSQVRGADQRDMVENWQHTSFNLAQCLSRAEMSLRNSGFYRHFDFDDDSIYGKNDDDYKGLIRCVTSESLVFFRVTGGHPRTRNQLLNQLEKNF